jgi:leader peptidase (prepilin peptidase)/N-methyltransferase
LDAVTVAVAAFIVGAVLGSFLNVLIHRLPRGESVVIPGSRCPHCGAPIAPWDNLPVVSYVVLRGRCRHCGAPISPRYVIVEAAAGLLLAGLAWRFGVTLEAVRYAVLGLALLVVFFTDLEHGLIPNAVTYPGIVAGIVFGAASGAWVPSLLAAAGAGGVFLLIALLSRGGMGGGDIKLAAMIGAFLGTPAVIVALFLAVALGAAAGLVLMALRLRTRKQTIPFGPALAAGALIAVFTSDAIVRWYMTRVV